MSAVPLIQVASAEPVLTVPAESPAEALLRLAEAAIACLPHAPARAEALAAFAAAGLPTTRDEAFKFTALRPLAERAPRLAVMPAQAETDTQLEPAAPLARPALGPLAGLGAAIGPAYALRLEETPPAPLRLRLANPAGGLSGFSLDLTLAAGVQATLELQERAAGVLLSQFTLKLAPGATLTIIRTDEGAADALSFTALDAQVAPGAILNVVTLGLGSLIGRLTARVVMEGPDAFARIDHATRLTGRRQSDLVSFVEHAGPGARSRQTARMVVDEQARGVFQGKVLVTEGAQKTDGFQLGRALLLSDRAEADLKPELEIYADDVKCSHGATIGRLDEEALFYLRQRGVPEAEARALLIDAFLAETLADLPEALRAPLATLLLQRPELVAARS